MNELSLSEQLCYVTTRIESSNDNIVSTGTGFFFDLNIGDNKYIPLLVTNKHVVQGMTKGKFLFTKSDNDGNPMVGNTFGIEYNVEFEKQWIFHPDDEVDLCVLPINVLKKAAEQLGHKLFYKTLTTALIPDEIQSKSIDAIEEVLMIGYPNGLWDKKNNMPIIRKGITATPYFLDFEGEKKFLIDMSVYPGSSGSPILLYNNGSYRSKEGSLVFGNRILLLGIVCQVYQRCITGSVDIIQTPIASAQLASTSNIPINLGIVIKAERLFDFIPLLVN